jgi:hypothetical protein
MTAPRTSDFKRGDTFLLTCTHKVSDVATSVTGFTIRSQVRNRFGQLVAELNATLANQVTSPGVFYLAPDDPDTSQWDVGDLSCDVEITNGGVIRSTVTFIVPCVDDITK